MPEPIKPGFEQWYYDNVSETFEGSNDCRRAYEAGQAAERERCKAAAYKFRDVCAEYHDQKQTVTAVAECLDWTPEDWGD